MLCGKEAVEFIHELQRQYFTLGNYEAVSEVLEDRSSWIGTGAHEICRSGAQAREILNRRTEEERIRFVMGDCSYEAVNLSEDICLVYGELSANPERKEMAPLYNRVTAICAAAPEGIRLLHLHLSCPDEAQRPGESFVRRDVVLERGRMKETMALTRQELERRIQEREIMLENIPGGYHQCRKDAGFTLITVSRGFLSLCGYTWEEIESRFNRKFMEIIHPDDREMVRREVLRQTEEGPDLNLEYRIVRGDGSEAWVMDQAALASCPDGGETYYCMLMDITSRKQEEEALRLSLQRHQVIMDQTTDIIFEWDIRRDTLFTSANWIKKFGYNAIDSYVSVRIQSTGMIQEEDYPRLYELMSRIKKGAPYEEAELRIRESGGSFIWCRVRATTQFDKAGKAIKAVGVVTDIDQDKKWRQELLDRAYRDALTGLYNKGTMRDIVESALCQPGKSEKHCLLMMDLDNFKQVNDRFGHLYGDAVLSDTAGVLKRLFPEPACIGRIGGDEFLVFLPGLSDREELSERAGDLIREIKQIGGKEKLDFFSCSVGLSVYPDDAADYLSLYQCADNALYYVKSQGKEGYAFYERRRAKGGAPVGVSSAVNETIDSEFGDVDQRLIQYVFRMLYESIDIETAIDHILEIVGRAYDVSRVYIFENSGDDQYCDNTFEWCNDGVSPEKEHLQHLSYKDDLGNYLNNFDENGVFYCRDVRTLHPSVYSILAPQEIESLLQCAIMDDGEVKGFVGFDECRMNRYWTKEQIATLELISKVLSTFLLKYRQKRRLDELLGERRTADDRK